MLNEDHLGPEELFIQQIFNPIQELLKDCLGTQVALIPSTDDLISDYIALPQAPIHLSSLRASHLSIRIYTFYLYFIRTNHLEYTFGLILFNSK
jgi:hypothetical protein